MTYSTSLKATTIPVAPLAIGTTLASFAFNALGIYGDGTGGDDHSTSEFLVVCGVAVVAALVVFGLVVPRTIDKPSSGRTALILAVLAVLAVPVFWAGITPALGVGAIILGLSGDRRTLVPDRSRARRARTDGVRRHLRAGLDVHQRLPVTQAHVGGDGSTDPPPPSWSGQWGPSGAGPRGQRVSAVRSTDWNCFPSVRAPAIGIRAPIILPSKDLGTRVNATVTSVPASAGVSW